MNAPRVPHLPKPIIIDGKVLQSAGAICKFGSDDLSLDEAKEMVKWIKRWILWASWCEDEERRMINAGELR